MVFCCIIGCSSGYKEENVPLFSMPSITINLDKRTEPLARQRQALWISRINRKDVSLRSRLKRRFVCAKHFVSGCAANLLDTTNVDWAPTLNLGYNFSLSSDAAMEPHELRGQQEEAQTNIEMQPSSEGSKTDSAGRPSRKRKHEESSSTHSQCPLLFQQLTRELPSSQEKEEPTVTVTMQPEEAELVCNLLSEARDEPFATLKGEPFSEKFASNGQFDGEPFSDNFTNNEQFDETVIKDEPFDDSVVNASPFDDTVVKDEPFDDVDSFDGNNEGPSSQVDTPFDVTFKDKTVANIEPFDTVTINSEPNENEDPLQDSFIKEEPLYVSNINTEPFAVTVVKNEPEEMLFFTETNSLDGQEPFHTVDSSFVSSDQAEFVDEIQTSSKMKEDVPKIESVVSLSHYFEQVVSKSDEVAEFETKPLVLINTDSSLGSSSQRNVEKLEIGTKNVVEFLPNVAEISYENVENTAKVQNVAKDCSTNVQNDIEIIDLETDTDLDINCVEIVSKPASTNSELAIKMGSGCKPRSLKSQAKSSESSELKSTISSSQQTSEPQCSKNCNQKETSSELAAAKSSWSGPNQINLFPRKTKLKSISLPTVKEEELYTHICKYHLKSDESQTIGPNITIPKLLKVSEPHKNFVGLYQCRRCPDLFESIIQLEVHLSMKHPTSLCDVLQCKICHFTLKPQLNMIVEHLRQHKNYYNYFVSPWSTWKCYECISLSNYCNDRSPLVQFNFGNITLLRTQIPNTYFQYKYDRSLPDLPHVRHMYACPLCTSRFETEVELEVHLEVHVDCGFRKCTCGVRCNNINELYAHVEKIHESVDGIMDFENRTGLEKLCSVQLQRMTNTEIQLYQKDIDYERLECPNCLVRFFDQKLFFAHCHPYTPLLPPAQECPDFGDNSRIDQANNFSCKICVKPHTSYTDLQDHVSRQHSRPMVYCVFCKVKVVSKHDAFIHLKMCYLKNSRVQIMRESNKHEYICPICGFICDDYDFLINHIRFDFSVLPAKHQCSFCLNFFFGKLNLAYHILDGKCIDH